MTTSPNVMVYAAMDGWRRQMVQHGHQLLGAALELAQHVREEIELIPMWGCSTMSCWGWRPPMTWTGCRS